MVRGGAANGEATPLSRREAIQVHRLPHPGVHRLLSFSIGSGACSTVATDAPCGLVGSVW
jgi:hypothetical protein